MIKELEKSKITQYKVHYEHILKMKNKIKFLLFLIITIIVLTGISSFQKEDKLENKDKLENIETIKKLYFIYNDGEIFQCKFKGERVYHAMRNARDASRIIYDKNGIKIGSCSYAWGKRIESICNQMTACEVIYRVKNVKLFTEGIPSSGQIWD